MNNEFTLDKYLIIKLDNRHLQEDDFGWKMNISYDLLEYLFDIAMLNKKSLDRFNDFVILFKYGKINNKFLYEHKELFKTVDIKFYLTDRQYLAENIVMKYIDYFNDVDKERICYNQKNLSIQFLQEYFSDSEDLILVNMRNKNVTKKFIKQHFNKVKHFDHYEWYFKSANKDLKHNICLNIMSLCPLFFHIIRLLRLYKIFL